MDIKRIVEAVIFASEEPVSISRIAEIVGQFDGREIRRMVRELEEEYSSKDLSFELVEVARGYQFRTRPQYAPWVRRVRSERKKVHLSQAALETLAIIAYKQPITKAEIEGVRGVDSGWVIKGLLEKGLIRILGRKGVPGRPLLYGTSRRFLELFSLKDLTSLPDIREIMELAGRDLRHDEETPSSGNTG